MPSFTLKKIVFFYLYGPSVIHGCLVMHLGFVWFDRFSMENGFPGNFVSFVCSKEKLERKGKSIVEGRGWM